MSHKARGFYSHSPLVEKHAKKLTRKLATVSARKNTVVMRQVVVRPVAKAHLVAETKISKKILVLAAKPPFHWA